VVLELSIIPFAVAILILVMAGQRGLMATEAMALVAVVALTAAVTVQAITEELTGLALAQESGALAPLREQTVVEVGMRLAEPKEATGVQI